MNAKRIMVAILAATGVGASNAAIPDAGGEYVMTKYVSAGGWGDFRPTNMTGNQTWIAEGDVTYCPFYPGSKNVCDFWQTYTGKSVTVPQKTDNCLFRVMKGNVIFENAITSHASNNYIGYLGPVKLMLRNGGSFFADADNVRIGQSYEKGTAGTATVFMEEPSTFATSGKWITVGDGLPGAFWMDGGLLTMTNAALYVGGNTAPGYVRLNGGTVSLRAENALAASIGNGAAYSSMHVSGGKLTSRKSFYGSAQGFCIGNKGNTAADLYADGGTIYLPNERFTVGIWSSYAGTATLTVDGSANIHVGLLPMGTSDNAGTAIVNLNGGIFQTDKGLANYGKTASTRQINFNGGTWRGPLDLTYPITVYPNGGSFYVLSSKADFVASPRLATGWGVKEITLTAAGSDYVTAPKVTISGGSGKGATGYAIMAKDRTIERVAVTCPGEGYEENDTLTVAFESTTGSGAVATVTLAANGTGTFHKTGAGVWHQTKDIAFDGDIAVDEGGLALDGVALTAAKSVKVSNGAWIAAGRSETNGVVRESSIHRFDVNNGAAELDWYGSAGIGKLTVGEIALNHGVVFVPKTLTNDLQLALTDTTLSANSASDSKVVNGLVYQHFDKSGYRSPSVFERLDDGTLSVVTNFTSTPTLDANFLANFDGKHASEATAQELPASLNCVVIPLSMTNPNYYVKSDELVEIKSGMIVHRRPQVAECHRFSMVGDGAFTTRAPGGMFIYADNCEIGHRSMNDDDKNLGVGAMRRIYGPFADPDDHTPMSLTIAGAKQSRPERGTVAWLTTDKDSYSGGLNLVNGGIVIYDNEGTSLGASGSPIRAYGYSSIGIYHDVFNIGTDHPIYIAPNAALIFSARWYSNGGNVISAPISGEGDLLTSDVDRSGYSIAYTGDHSGFSGTYYIQGHARIAPETFSPLAGICLADGTNGVGVIETSGFFNRVPGTDKGEVCWKLHKAYGSAYKLCGGFAARGGDFTVNLGGDGMALVPEEDYLPKGTMIQLQSQYANGVLDFQNGFALSGKTQKVRVWAGKTATISGVIGDTVGGGQLAVEGNINYAGTLTVNKSNLAADKAMIAVDGNLDLSASTLELNATAAELAAYEETGVVLTTATGTITGKPTLTSAPDGWILRARKGELTLTMSKGMILIVK